MLHQLLATASWALLAFITYLTLSRIQYRPTLPGGPEYDRLFAFVALGAFFAAAYPKRLFLVCIVVLGSAVLLEFAQTLTRDRHRQLLDATQKLLGGSVGILAGLIVVYLTPRSWFDN